MRLVIEDAVREKFGISVGVAAIRGVRQKESSEISKAITEVEEASISEYKTRVRKPKLTSAFLRRKTLRWIYCH